MPGGFGVSEMEFQTAGEAGACDVPQSILFAGFRSVQRLWLA